MNLSTVPEDMMHVIDADSNPCADFYDFACGSWRNSASLKSDQMQLSLSWSTISKRIRSQLLHVVAGDSGRAGALFRSCLNLSAVRLCLYFIVGVFLMGFC